MRLLQGAIHCLETAHSQGSILSTAKRNHVDRFPIFQWGIYSPIQIKSPFDIFGSDHPSIFIVAMSVAGLSAFFMRHVNHLR